MVQANIFGLGLLGLVNGLENGLSSVALATEVCFSEQG